MDVVDGLSKTKRKDDHIWVVIEWLTKTAYFLPIWSTNTKKKLAKVCVSEVVRLYRVPYSIVSNTRMDFTSHL